MKNDEFVLCFIKDGLAYFTSQPLEAQTGEDWNDTPYETNAGLPSTAFKGVDSWRIKVYRYEGTMLDTPAELSGGYTPYSVEDINAKAVAWLYGRAANGKKIAIYAGETLAGFKKLVKRAGGTVTVVQELKYD